MVTRAQDTVTTSIEWPWVIAVVLVAITAVGALGWWFAHRRHTVARSEDVVWVANSDFVEQIPQFTSWVRRYRALQWTGFGALALATVAAAVMAARPVEIETTSSTLASRDIVLCLDVSTSMIAYDHQVVDVFTELVENFDGERIALSIFNATSQTTFPLTDDYTLVEEQLKEAREALDPALAGDGYDPDAAEKYSDFTVGTLGTNEGSSLIGDGLANCTLLFDEAETERSRSIILATDNDLAGEPVYSLQQAVDLAVKKDISINGLYGEGEAFNKKELAAEYKSIVEAAGGHYYYVGDPSAVQSMVDEVQSEQAVALDAVPEVTRTDRAGPFFVIALIGLVGLVLVQWRLRE